MANPYPNSIPPRTFTPPLMADFVPTRTPTPPPHQSPSIPTPPPLPTAPLISSGSTPLSHSLRRLQTFLSLLGLFPLSPSHIRLHPLLLPSITFLFLGLALPIISIALSNCSNLDSTDACEKYGLQGFEICVLAFHSAVAAISLVCVSRSLGKYGMRRFLFNDQRYPGTDSRFQKAYLAKIQAFFRIVIWWIIPCLIVKLTRESFFFMHLLQHSIFRSILVFATSTISWTYQTSIILSSCALFHLVCHLQVIHFENYGKLLEQDLDPLMLVEEHVLLRYNLSKISHRFRMFLLLLFSFVTVSLFVILFQTTAYSGTVNFTNGGNIAVCSVVQVVGLVMCLHGAAKISHRAQGIASLASRWHALVTCSTSTNTTSATNLNTTSNTNLDFSMHGRTPSLNNNVDFSTQGRMPSFNNLDYSTQGRMPSFNNNLDNATQGRMPSFSNNSEYGMHGRVQSSGNLVSFPANLMMMDFSESDDLESLDYNGGGFGNGNGNAMLAWYMSSYHKREALVSYLLSNQGGITLFGLIIDRTFLNTILMLELTLVLFVLGKTIVIPNQATLNSIHNIF